MSKHLFIRYGDAVLFDGPTGQVKWTETDDGVVEVRAAPPGVAKRGVDGGALMRALTQAGAKRSVNGAEGL